VSAGPPGARVGREAFRDLIAYQTDRDACDIDLSDNTSLFGAPPAALRVLRGLDGDDVTRYPGLYARELRRALAAYAEVQPSEIVTGCGSDDVIDSTIRAVAEPGEAIAFPDPTFSMIPVFARVNGLRPIAVPIGRDHDLDFDAMLATDARIIYLCSPNNPTGVVASREGIERVLEHARGIVILDEAYAEFAGTGLTARAPAHGRLVVTRTLSKAFGLAGLRLGYATAAAPLVVEIEKARGPYTTNGPGERAALAALTEDLPWVRARTAEAVAIRERLAEALRARGLEPLPSGANFLLVPIEAAAGVADRMRERGVAVRAFRHVAGVGDAIRISVGPWTVMTRMLAVLDEARRCA
jgi:histidinol-phosphate aminotransferase